MTIKVGAAAIFDADGRILCCKRDDSSSHPGKWEFPGGKVEEGEGIGECIIRELDEELNLEIRLVEEIISVEYSYELSDVLIHLWHCVLMSESYTLKLNCHSEVKWLYADEMTTLDWVDADNEIVEFLQTYEI